MNGSNVKLIRGQVRQVVKEELPAVLGAEAIEAMEKRIMAHLDARLNIIAEQVKSTLTAIDERSQKIQSLVVREANKVT